LQTIKYHLGKGSAPAAPLPKPQNKLELNGTVKSTLSGQPGMAKIIGEFVRDLPGEVQKLRNFLNAAQMDSLRRVVHQLRGSGGGYGFESITELATVAEAARQPKEANRSIRRSIR
jgi:HPt (histidine-containing phosphotransfer) domain-containing protein